MISEMPPGEGVMLNSSLPRNQKTGKPFENSLNGNKDSKRPPSENNKEIKTNAKKLQEKIKQQLTNNATQNAGGGSEKKLTPTPEDVIKLVGLQVANRTRISANGNDRTFTPFASNVTELVGRKGGPNRQSSSRNEDNDGDDDDNGESGNGNGKDA